MVAENAQWKMTKFISPFAYALALVPAIVVTVAVGSVLSGIFGTGVVWYLLLVVAGLVVGAGIFGGIGRFLIVNERLQRSGLTDHLRRCALLYFVLALTLVWGVKYYLTTGGVGWPTFATEMQLHILSVILAALTVDRLAAPSVVKASNGGISR